MLSVVVLLKLVSYTHAQLFDPLPMPAIIPDLASCAYVRMSDDAPALVLCCGQRHGNLVAPPECLTECVLEYEEPDMTLKRWAIIVISTTVSPTSPKFQSPPSTLQSSALTTSSPVTTAGTASQLGNGSNGQNTAAGAAATTDQVTATSESDKVPSTTDGQSGAITTETSSCSPSKNVAGGIREIMVMLLASLAMVVVV
ncbi:hypothetical protein DYB28_015638 [Aphanomyces astaci]|uniref:Uncharacterized protein n=1 Tax=Aphanomyces astaci TaxID=112090 RepID=A0A9X8EAX0_APHAT|nr:hypothetical protein DYB28_015638 [Aphanomyces astaci]